MNRVLLPLMTSVLFSGSYIAGEYTTLDPGSLTTTLPRYLIALLFSSALASADRDWAISCTILSVREIGPTRTSSFV